MSVLDLYTTVSGSYPVGVRGDLLVNSKCVPVVENGIFLDLVIRYHLYCFRCTALT